MKTKLITALAVLLMACIVLSCFAALTAATPDPDKDRGKSADAHKKYGAFTLEAKGTAYNADNEEVTVDITITGNANGKTKTVFHLRTQGGGNIQVADYAPFSAVKGQGVIVNKNHFIHLNLMVGGTYYGGMHTVWILRGTTVDMQENTDGSITIDADLTSRRIILPLEGYPQLTNVNLNDCTITLF